MDIDPMTCDEIIDEIVKMLIQFKDIQCVRMIYGFVKGLSKRSSLE